MRDQHLEGASDPEWLVESIKALQDRAYDIMTTALRAHPKIDLVYAHNDPMAFGAYLAARGIGEERLYAAPPRISKRTCPDSLRASTSS